MHGAARIRLLVNGMIRRVSVMLPHVLFSLGAQSPSTRWLPNGARLTDKLYLKTPKLGTWQQLVNWPDNPRMTH